MSYIECFKKTRLVNDDKLLFMKSPINLYFLRQLSFFVTPLLIAAKISPNIISLTGLLLGIFSTGIICIGYENYFSLGILLYLLSLLLDFCDGNVARLTEKATFFGRFIDGVIDIVLCSALRFSLSSVALYKFQNEKLMWIGIFCTVLTPFHHLYYDRYSAFARWIKEEEKINIKPYIRSAFLPGINSILLDLQFACIVLFPFIIETKEFIYICYIYFIIHIALALYYIIIHTLYSYKNMNINASPHR